MSRGGLQFGSIRGSDPGTVLALLESAYAPLLAMSPRAYRIWHEDWVDWDAFVYDGLDIIDSFCFLSSEAGSPIGFASWDPRGFPQAVVGHNCIAAGYKGRGLGATQMRHLLAVLAERGFQRARAETGADDFFRPARRMYESCGFSRVSERRETSPIDLTIVAYEIRLDTGRSLDVSGFGDAAPSDPKL